MTDILKDYYADDIEHFAKDLFLIVSVAMKIDKEYADGNDCDRDIKRFEKFVYDWNTKYPQLIARVRPDGIKFRLKLLLNEKDLKKVFLDAAVRISNIRSINNNNVGVKQFDEDNLRHTVRLIRDKLDIVYEVNGKENSITIKMDLDTKRAKVIFHPEDMFDMSSPEFQICAFYALLKYDPSVNLQKHKANFSFDTDSLYQIGRGDISDKRKDPSFMFGNE